MSLPLTPGETDGPERDPFENQNGHNGEGDNGSHNQGDDKGQTFRKRRLSLNNLRQLDSDGEEEHHPTHVYGTVERASPSNTDADTLSLEADEKAHSFRKRRLSLTLKRQDDSVNGDDNDTSDPSSPKRRRRNSEYSVDTIDSNSNNLKSRTAHATELLSHPTPSSSLASPDVPILYQQAAPPQQSPMLDFIAANGSTPRWKKRHTRHADEKSLPFPKDIVGTFSCHGVEPIYDSDYQPEFDEEDEDDEEWGVGNGAELGGKRLPNPPEESSEKPTMMAKTNQDRGGIAFPYGNCPKTALFAVYDGRSTCFTT